MVQINRSGSSQEKEPRTPIIAGNWKMNKTVGEALSLVDIILEDLDAFEGVEIVLVPPFIALYPVLELLEDTNIRLGAQNMYHQESGAYTGEVSPLMLREICDYVIIGHSERRAYFGETDEMVNLKVKAAFRHDLNPIVAVGESLAQHEAGHAKAHITSQLENGLKGISEADAVSLIIAYEPIWAIGTGRAANGAIAQEICAHIRQTLARLFSSDVAAQIRIQYGGSVTGDNIAEYIRQPDIDGALVGGASLKAEEFVKIVDRTIEADFQKQKTGLR